MNAPESLRAARDEIAERALCGALAGMCAVGIGAAVEGPELVICTTDPVAMKRALDSGFLARELPVTVVASARPLATLVVPPARLVPMPDLRIGIGDAIGPAGGSTGRLGTLLDRDGQLLAFSAGHVFTRERQDVYCKDRPVGRVLRLVRPQGGVAVAVDAAVIEPSARPTVEMRYGDLRLEPGLRDPECGEAVRLVTQRRCSSGTVCMTSAVARVRNGEDEYWLPDQFVIEGVDFAIPGDSGCAVVGADGRSRGMLVAGEGSLFVATQTRRLLAAFGLSDTDLLPSEPQRAA